MLLARKVEVNTLDKRSNSAESEETRLIGLVANGDRRAFETLYRMYFPRLRRFLQNMTRSANIIEEVVNDTMLVVWQKAHTYNHSCKLSTWIFSIAYRKTLKAIQGLDEPVDVDLSLCSSEHGADVDIARREMARDVRYALETLPFEQRSVVIFTYFHGMAYEEIAETMGCPINTVKTRMFHARNRLKPLLCEQLEK